MNRREYLKCASQFASRGEARHNAVLNPEKVRWIRENRRGLSAKAQAEILGCHIRTIDKVRDLKTWVHVS